MGWVKLFHGLNFHRRWQYRESFQLYSTTGLVFCPFFVEEIGSCQLVSPVSVWFQSSLKFYWLHVKLYSSLFTAREPHTCCISCCIVWSLSDCLTVQCSLPVHGNGCECGGCHDGAGVIGHLQSKVYIIVTGTVFHRRGRGKPHLNGGNAMDTLPPKSLCT